MSGGRIGLPGAVNPAADGEAARYRPFTVVTGRLAAAEAEHAPWPLHRATVLSLGRGGQRLVSPAALPCPR